MYTPQIEKLNNVVKGKYIFITLKSKDNFKSKKVGSKIKIRHIK